MGYVLSLIADELKSFTALTSKYEQQLAALPKGSLRAKKRGEQIYYYLAYRDGSKVLTDYIGKDEGTIARLIDQLERRRQIEVLLSRLNDEIALMEKLTGEIK